MSRAPVWQDSAPLPFLPVRFWTSCSVGGSEGRKRVWGSLPFAEARAILGYAMNTMPGQFLQPYISAWLPWLYGHSYWWTVLGFTGSAMFGSRFLLQWLASEKKRELVVPSYFWYLSFWGSVINLIYAFHIDNAPIIFGVIALPFIYGRNLVLLRRGKLKQVQNAEVIAVKPGAALAPTLNPT